MKTSILKVAFYCCLCTLLYSCMKDVDFDQADDIVLEPDVDLDLIFFNLNTSNFQGTDPNIPVSVVRDTTRLDFLDDDFVRDNLRQIDFLFQYDNSFSQAFENRAQFLNEEDEVQYEVVFDVVGSPDGSAQTTLHTETITNPELDAIRASIKMVINLTLLPDTNPVEGELTHQSKAVYKLSF